MMIVITYIATIVLLFILPPLFIFAMIKPNKFQKLFKEGKVTRSKILSRTLLVGFILFVVVGLTAPPETEANKLARQAESVKVAEVDKIKNQESDQIKKIADMENAKKITDEQNSKLASTVDLHNSNIIVEASDKVVYSIVPNSHQYDVRINILDVNKKTVVTTDINHSTKNWSITVDDKPVYDNGTIKYLTYSVSVNNKYYNSEKIIEISKDYKNYFKLVDSIKISN
ncbi:MAG: hypothetical protein Q8T08_13315, partial [Ignavibacteria bacterium]|nr:hypothetical protein [Ignavibacteria bacterium]